MRGKRCKKVVKQTIMSIDNMTISSSIIKLNNINYGIEYLSAIEIKVSHVNKTVWFYIK